MLVVSIGLWAFAIFAVAVESFIIAAVTIAIAVYCMS